MSSPTIPPKSNTFPVSNPSPQESQSIGSTATQPATADNPFLIPEETQPATQPKVVEFKKDPNELHRQNAFILPRNNQ